MLPRVAGCWPKAGGDSPQVKCAARLSPFATRQIFPVGHRPHILVGWGGHLARLAHQDPQRCCGLVAKMRSICWCEIWLGAQRAVLEAAVELGEHVPRQQSVGRGSAHIRTVPVRYSRYSGILQVLHWCCIVVVLACYWCFIGSVLLLGGYCIGIVQVLFWYWTQVCLADAKSYQAELRSNIGAYVSDLGDIPLFGAEFGREADFGGPSPIWRIGSGPAKSSENTEDRPNPSRERPCASEAPADRALDRPWRLPMIDSLGRSP